MRSRSTVMGTPSWKRPTGSRPLPVRLIGRLLVKWETYIYAKLQGITGIPSVVPSPRSLHHHHHLHGRAQPQDQGENPGRGLFRTPGAAPPCRA
ncbi:MAG: hypothetical protein MZV70_72965 [Desulfobacterales bacterium]|nr:hypothetical protein [Desulfobacterales bacterium]